MAKFELGQLVATRGVYEKMCEDKDFFDFVNESMCRFESCDWGDMCSEDKALNEEAVSIGEGRIHGSYIHKPSDEKLWIITESDRSATTILFPSEY